MKAPTWIAGLHGARAGIHMPALPRPGTPSYAMGWGGSDVHWNDRGQVDQLGQAVCVPLACYTGVLVIDEFNPDEPGLHQLKYYARGVGGIRVGWRGVNEVEREVLELVSLEHLSPSEMDELRRTVLAQEARGLPAQPRRLRDDGTDRPVVMRARRSTGSHPLSPTARRVYVSGTSHTGGTAFRRDEDRWTI